MFAVTQYSQAADESPKGDSADNARLKLLHALHARASARRQASSDERKVVEDSRKKRKISVDKSSNKEEQATSKEQPKGKVKLASIAAMKATIDKQQLQSVKPRKKAQSANKEAEGGLLNDAVRNNNHC